MKNNKKSGFTLVEATVVLAMVGVLALILTPLVKNLMPNDHNIKYKKAFTTTQELIAALVNDQNICQQYDMNSGTSYRNNPLRFCNAVTQDNGDNNNMNTYTTRYLAREMCQRMSLMTDVNCNTISTAANTCWTNQTTDGTRWAIPNVALSTNAGLASTLIGASKTIVVDIDGGNNAINCNSATSEANGVYRIIINSTGKVAAPAGGVEANLLLSNPANN